MITFTKVATEPPIALVSAGNNYPSVYESRQLVVKLSDGTYAIAVYQKMAVGGYIDIVMGDNLDNVVAWAEIE